MAELKTRPTGASVDDFIAALEELVRTSVARLRKAYPKVGKI